MNKQQFEELKQKAGSEYVIIDPDMSRITFQIQNGPVLEMGNNGCQIDDIGKMWVAIVRLFNLKYPCRENSITITKIEEALLWQHKRYVNRKNRHVEGRSLK